MAERRWGRREQNAELAQRPQGCRGSLLTALSVEPSLEPVRSPLGPLPLRAEEVELSVGAALPPESGRRLQTTATAPTPWS